MLGAYFSSEKSLTNTLMGDPDNKQIWKIYINTIWLKNAMMKQRKEIDRIGRYSLVCSD